MQETENIDFYAIPYPWTAVEYWKILYLATVYFSTYNTINDYSFTYTFKCKFVVKITKHKYAWASY